MPGLGLDCNSVQTAECQGRNSALMRPSRPNGVVLEYDAEPPGKARLEAQRILHPRVRGIAH